MMPPLSFSLYEFKLIISPGVSQIALTKDAAVLKIKRLSCCAKIQSNKLQRNPYPYHLQHLQRLDQSHLNLKIH